MMKNRKPFSALTRNFGEDRREAIDVIKARILADQGAPQTAP